MNDRSTEVSRLIDAPRGRIYQAFLDPDALAAWLPPGSMTGVVHAFEGREGGRIRMSLIYPPDETSMRGKSAERTDTFQARFAQLVPDTLVVWVAEFESTDPSFVGKMIVTTRLVPKHSATEVTIRCDAIPPGIRLEDNEAGCRASLEMLAAFVTQ
jgi:uncharacterized protein YndB with AHSA1/START domain